MAVQTRAPARHAGTAPPVPSRPPAKKPGSAWFSRATDPRIVLAVACAIVLASVGGFVTKNSSIDIAGVVVDARTKQPVKSAQLSAIGLNVTTNGKGAFTVRDIKRGTQLRISADNYRHTDVEATSDPLRVALRPIPVTGRVSSAFTGKPIGASVIAGKVRQGSKSDGTFSIYGVGPGDTLTITAFGHQAKKIKVGPNRSVAASLELGRIDPARVLKPISGYGSSNAPADLVAAMRAEPGFIPINPAHITGVAVRSVTKDGESIGLVISTAVDPAWAAVGGTQQLFFEAFSTGAAKHKDVRIGGIKARYVQDQGFAGYAWQRFAAFVMVITDTSMDAKRITESLIGGKSAIPFDSV